ncbi:MAG TPA: SurA N-terminal domain-containing protein [Bdellovibrionota bacterium]|nr:SurA N-terminal domain-containing protein [Bdellovibrionota bacterium]
MLAVMREKFGPVFIGTFVAAISFVFVFWGIWGKGAGMGGMSGTDAGAVNGEPIPLSEFNKELNRRLEMYKGLNLNEEQIKQFHIRESVFEDMVDRKLMLQKAESLGMQPGDAEVRESIMQIPAFQTDGKFDRPKYEQLLAANHYTLSGFEEMVRKDVQSGFWRRYLKSFVKVSDEEIQQEFVQTKERRKFKYVYLTAASGQKGVKVDPTQLMEFFKNPDKERQAKTRFELAKDTRFKGKKFEDVKMEIARDIIASESPDLARKANDELAGRVLGMLAPADAADKKLNDVLKGFDTSVKDSGWVMRRNRFLPGVGEAETLFKEAFSDKPSFDPKTGGKAKRFDLPGGILLVLMTGTEHPDMAQLNAEEKNRLFEQLAYRKENDLQEQWSHTLRENAKVARNQQLFAGGSGGGGSPGGDPMGDD